MKCAWSAFLAVVPQRLRCEVDKLGKDCLEELRLRCGQPVELILGGQSLLLQTIATADDIQYERQRQEERRVKPAGRA